jgi:hypothetical protein
MDNACHKIFTFCHLGARNSFTERPISPYVRGETQKHQFNQTGIEAAINSTYQFVLSADSLIMRLTRRVNLTFVDDEAAKYYQK